MWNYVILKVNSTIYTGNQIKKIAIIITKIIKEK